MSRLPAPGTIHTGRLRHAAVVIAAAALMVTGCSIGTSKDATPGSLAQGASLKGATFTVGSKEFTEQLILCQITILALQSAGATVHSQCGLNGSNTARTALTSGSIDMYWEYTGTAWISYLKHTDPVKGAAAQYQAAAKEDSANGIVWLNPAPYNDTYTIVANPTVAHQLGVTSLSDYAKLVASDPAKASMCAATEFLSRNDGWPGLQQAYRFTLPQADLATISEGTIYNAVSKGNPCNFGEGVATDGRIKELKLTTLTDDKEFFPLYNPALIVRRQVATANPDLAKVINPIAAALDVSTIQDLDADVDIQGQQPEDTARAWLQSKGFIGK